MKIITEFWSKPMPDRRWDWLAFSEDYEGGDPVGHGATEVDARCDLHEKLAAFYADQSDTDAQKADAASYTAVGHAQEIE